MSTLRHSFQPGSLSDIEVMLDARGGDILSRLALILSDLGARVVVRDENPAPLRRLHLSISEQEPVPDAPDTAAALIRMFSKAGPVARASIHLCGTFREATDILENSVPAGTTSQILIVANESRAERIVLEQLLALQDDRQVHALLVPPADGGGPAVAKFPVPPAIFDLGSMTALIALLLGPHGRGIPNQSIRFDRPGCLADPA